MPFRRPPLVLFACSRKGLNSFATDKNRSTHPRPDRTRGAEPDPDALPLSYSRVNGHRSVPSTGRHGVGSPIEPCRSPMADGARGGIRTPGLGFRRRVRPVCVLLLEPSGKTLTVNLFYVSLTLTLARSLEPGSGFKPPTSLVETGRSILLSYPGPRLVLLPKHVRQDGLADLVLRH